MTESATRHHDVPPAGRYEIQPERTVVRFRTRAIFGLLPVRGTYRVTGGHIRLHDPVESSTVTVTVDAASFDSGNAERDRHVRSADFLAVEEHPEITFRAGRVRPAGDGEPAVLDGELTVRGVRRPVSLTVLTVRSGENGRDLVATARTVVDRYEFGITRSKGMAGRRQVLELEVTAAR